MLVDVKALWTGQDREGIAAIFECDAASPLLRGHATGAFEIASRILAALTARDAAALSAVAAYEEPEPVVVVLDPSANAGYRSRGELVALEDEMSAAGWTVALEGNPRVLFSREPLDREARKALAARSDCVAVVGAREAIELARSAPIVWYVEADGAYERSRDIERPLRADELRGLKTTPLARSFATSPVVRFEPREAEPIVELVQRPYVDEGSVLAVGALGVVLVGLPIAAIVLGVVAFVAMKDVEVAWLPILVVTSVVMLVAALGARAWLKQPVRVRVAQAKRIATPEQEEEEPADESATEEGSRR
jgi:hypothetical protein